MVHCFEASPPDTAVAFMSGFFATLGREWTGLDRFRMDKFMMLARRFLRQTFVFAKKSDWSDDIVDKVPSTIPLLKDAMLNQLYYVLVQKNLPKYGSKLSKILSLFLFCPILLLQSVDWCGNK